MKVNLDFLERALSTAAFRRTWREALEKLQEILWADILMRQAFTTYGAAQFVRDVNAILTVVERHLPSGVGAMSSLKDALVLLNLPVDAENGNLSLKAASDRIFTDNTEAKKTLEELGIVTITPANARQILQRRVENSE
jgi:RAD50-interacting protein 1